MNTQTSITKPLPESHINTIRSTIVIGLIVALALSVYNLYVALTSQQWQAWIIFADTTVLSISDLIALRLIKRGRPSTGVWLLILAVNSCFIVGSFTLKNSGSLAGITTASLMGLLALQALSTNRERIIATTLSIISGMVCVLIDQFESTSKLAISNQTFTFIAIGAAISTLGFLYTAFREYRNFNLQTKIIFIFVVSTAIVTTAGTLVSLPIVRNLLESDANEKLRSAADHTRDLIDTFVLTQLNSIRVEAQSPVITEFFQQENSSNTEELNLTLQSFKQIDPQNIISYAILDKDGNVLIDTDAASVGSFEGDRDYIKQPSSTGLPYMSTWYSINSLYFSAPITGKEGITVGFLRVQYDLSILQQFILKNNELGGRASFPILIDENNIILSHGTSSDLVLRSVAQVPTDHLAPLISSGQLAEDNVKNLTGIYKNIDPTLTTSNNREISTIQDENGQTLYITTTPLLNAPWFIIYCQPEDVFLNPINTWGHTSTLLAMSITLLTIFIATIFVNILTTPIIRLTNIVKQLSEGNLDIRAEVSTRDEIGELANTFNQMTSQLNTSFSTLEERVIERTVDLEYARSQSEKRANELQAIGETSRIISSEQKLESLLPLVARLVSEKFNFYHVGIFLIDESTRFAVLHAANSAGGKKMLERRHMLEVGGSGIVGYVAKHGNPRIALDVGLDAVFFNNPDLPNTRSEIGLPLTVRGKILGVLDVQSEKPGAFTQNDANTLAILADQIAIAIENAKLFEQTQAALSESQALYRQNIQRGWSNFATDQEIIGYHQTMTEGKTLTQFVESEDIRDVINRGEMLKSAVERTKEISMIVPIKLRGQVIGTLKVGIPERMRTWTQDETNFVEAISDRLSLALENARLIQESQKQVIKEQTISDVTSKISASFDLRSVLQTAVEELGRAMPGSEVLIRFDDNEKK